jgi:multidrug efflux pump subunit AcrB
MDDRWEKLQTDMLRCSVIVFIFLLFFFIGVLLLFNTILPTMLPKIILPLLDLVK